MQVTLTVVSTDQSGQQSPVGSTNLSLKPSEFVQFGGPAGATTADAASATDSSSASTTGRVLDYRISSVPERSGEVIQLFARTAQGGATINMPILPPVGDYAHLAPSASSSATSSPSATSSRDAPASVDTSGAATQSPSDTASPSS